eukprot:m.100633 g.100633  ORF g.100633 m.100633 type:complete len:51 (+) comp13715_c1_seq1:1554-1706(+)
MLQFLRIVHVVFLYMKANEFSKVHKYKGGAPDVNIIVAITCCSAIVNIIC